MINEFDSKAKTWDLDTERVIRTQKIGDDIIKQINFRRPLTAFEYGCGTGVLSLYFHLSFQKIICADSSEGMLQALKGKIAAQSIANVFPVQIDLLSSPLPKDKFDVIYTMLTLHHVLDIEKLLASFYSMLNPEGMLFIADLDKEDGSFHGAGFIGHNGFDRDELKGKVSKAGFKNIVFETATEINKTISDGSTKSFPVFLMKAEKKNTNI